MASEAGIHQVRPSSWPIRRERQRIAHTSLTAIVANIEGKIDKLTALVESLLTTTHSLPPGLHCTETELLQDRIERLETLFVCSPQASPTVDDVLNRILPTSSKCDAKGAVALGSIPEFPFEALGARAADSKKSPPCAYFDIGDCYTDSLAEKSRYKTSMTPSFVNASCQTTAVPCDTNDDTKAHDEYQKLVGEWLPIDCLNINDIVRVAEPFHGSTQGVRLWMQSGTIGRVTCVDDEGDVEVRFPSLAALYPRERNRWILQHDLKSIEKYKKV